MRMSEDQKPQELTVPQPKPGAMSMGFGQRGAEIRTLDDAFRIARAVHMSGFSPLKTVEANFIAIQLGAEIGLPPMAAVQSIYAVNNRPGMMVANALAIVESSGALADIEEKIEGQGDARKAVCKITRKGRQPYTVEYSMADARKAELTGKDNWRKFQDRMLKARALGYALQDRFKDKLMGIGIVEVMHDITSEVEVVSEKTESKPSNMDQFVEKFATPAPEPLARQEQPIGKEEPVIVKPDQKPAAPNIQVWIKLNKDIKAAINKAKTSDEVNTLINSTHKVTLSDMQKSQPDFYNEIMDYAMDKQASFHERGTKLSQTDLLNNN